MKLLVVLMLLAGYRAHAQTPATDKAPPASFANNTAQPEMQTYVLDFKQEQVVPQIAASPLLEIPFQCTADGAIFLDSMDPKNLQKTLYSIQGKDVVQFDPKSGTGVRDVEVIGYFPTASMVAFLVSGVKADAVIDPNVGTARSRHRFVEEFDRKGGFIKSVPVGVDYPLFRFAVMGGGGFLVSAYDAAMDEEKLLVLDDDGLLVRTIDQPLSETERAARKNATADQRLLAGMRSAGQVSFAGYKDSVLAWRHGTNNPVLEIAPDGSSREVTIALPKGMVLADMLPSDDEWVIHVQRADLPDNVAHDLSSYAYYEVSGLDGSLLRKLTIVNPRIGSIACKARGKYVAFSTDKDKKLVELAAADR